ncbi:hypothetical protein C8Q79DRAFT_311917 [Trametes meyenii]|nr:hypothetical protein C8Q79DRAFT_311917 [Trametes meyenii]
MTHYNSYGDILSTHVDGSDDGTRLSAVNPRHPSSRPLPSTSLTAVSRRPRPNMHLPRGTQCRASLCKRTRPASLAFNVDAPSIPPSEKHIWGTPRWPVNAHGRRSCPPWARSTCFVPDCISRARLLARPPNRDARTPFPRLEFRTWPPPNRAGAHQHPISPPSASSYQPSGAGATGHLSACGRWSSSHGRPMELQAERTDAFAPFGSSLDAPRHRSPNRHHPISQC